MNRSIEAVIEGLLPALYNLHGSPEAVRIAHHAAESLVCLIDTGALRAAGGADSIDDFLIAIGLDPRMAEQDVAVAATLVSAVDARTGLATVSYAQITKAIGLASGVVRGSVSRLRNGGYFQISYPDQKDIEAGDHCLRYRPDLGTRVAI